MKNGNKVSIREVYIITQRLEDKIDKFQDKLDGYTQERTRLVSEYDDKLMTLDGKISNLEGRASILAIVWSSIIAMAGIFLGGKLK